MRGDLLVDIKGPRFRSVKINPDRKLKFNLNRKLPFRNKGVVFRTGGINIRKRGVNFGKSNVSNIELSDKDDPVKLNNLGVDYYNAGKLKTALNYFNKALSVAPQFELASTNRLLTIQAMREKHEKELKARQKAEAQALSSYTKTSKIRNIKSKRSMDYKREKYSYLDNYGNIPRTNSPRDNNYNYINEFGWRQSRRR
jgi:tetratricopeptide (TPR) repeat protein